MNLLIIQARMGSTRLPGKVLRTIGGRSLLELQHIRVRAAKNADKIVIATTTNPEDDAIAEFCREKGIDCSRGSDWDVLDRYYNAALPYRPRTVIRITSDCPLHHHSVIDFVIEAYYKSGADYYSNSNNEPDYLEDGFDTEVFSFSALEIAAKEARMASEREHVTPFIKNSGRFSCKFGRYNPDYKYKLSVDTPEDFKTVETIFRSFENVEDFGMNDVLALLKKRPEIVEINSRSVPNAGYKKSIENDRNIKTGE